MAVLLSVVSWRHVKCDSYLKCVYVPRPAQTKLFKPSQNIATEVFAVTSAVGLQLAESWEHAESEYINFLSKFCLLKDFKSG